MAYLTSIIGENDVFEVSSSSYITPLDAEYSDCKIELSGEYLRAVDMDNILIQTSDEVTGEIVWQDRLEDVNNGTKKQNE